MVICWRTRRTTSPRTTGVPMSKRTSPASRLKGIVILHEDRDILVVNKPAGLLTMGTDKEKERTAYYILTDYVRKGQIKSRNRIFIVHRLDRETSGILIFAKTEEAKFRLQEEWDNTSKQYLAVVYGKLAKSSDTITSYLAENSARVVYSTHDSTKGKLAHTAYKVLKETREFSLLEVNLLTGRKNQIRVHLADIGHPIVGDKKYGEQKPDKATGFQIHLLLHAHTITFNHPFNGKPLTFSAPVPRYFNSLIGEIEPLT
jgi:RluA family pseudouridine synthase